MGAKSIRMGRVFGADGRAVVVVATASGEALMRAAQRRRIEAIAGAIARLPAADQRRLAAAAPLLDTVAASLRGQQVTGS